MIKKVITFTSVSALIGAGVAAVISKKTRPTVDEAEYQSTLSDLRQFNSSLQREIVRSHRDARDVCIAVVNVNGLSLKKDKEWYREVESRFADTVRGSDLLASNDTGEFYLLFPEAGLDEGYEAIERMQETLPSTLSLAAGIAAWDHCETASELVSRAVASMQGEANTSRAKIAVAETPTAKVNDEQEQNVKSSNQ